MIKGFVSPPIGQQSNMGFKIEKDFARSFDGELMDGMSIDKDFLNASGCGIRPICALTKACRDRQSAWQECVNRNSATKYEGKFGAPADALSNPAPTSNTNSNATSIGMSSGAKIGIALGILAVAGISAYFLIRK